MTEQVTQISFSQYGGHLRQKYGEKRRPVQGSLELTFRCNLDCIHCYCRLPSEDKQAKSCELSFEEICKIIDDAAEAGCMWLLITGGEPIIRPDFIDIYTYAKRKGLFITLFTNGTMVSDKIADYLKEYSPYLVEITLYGATAKTHEEVTRIPSSFQRSLDGIHRLLERGIRLKLKTMAMTINRDELDDMRELANSLGVKFRYDPMINAPFNGSREALKYRLTPEEVVELELSDIGRVEEYQEICEKFGGTSDTVFGCGAGLYNFHVDPYGQMSMCISGRWPSYNLRDGSLKEGFYSFFPELRSRKPESDYPCGQCNLHSICNNCPGTAYPEKGDIESVVDYYCQIAHLRAASFITK